ncbi:hypothetical protein [uncultured Dialister sp.]|jgi:hypothetical protein|nr:hypothetical protein [uncultured Dialister sp.]
MMKSKIRTFGPKGGCKGFLKTGAADAHHNPHTRNFFHRLISIF